jgi:hypothetical protein
MALFTDIVGPLAALYVTAHSPVELVVTAPDGSQTGFDSTTGTHLNSIPLSAYLALSLANDQFKMLSPTPEIKSFSANDPKSGSYVVQVFGTNTGEYTLDFTGYDTDGKISQAPSLTGSIIPGVTKQLTISYSSAAGSSVTVTQAVTTIANIQTEIEIAAQQGFIDNRGIVNSLSSKLRNAQAAFSAGQPQVAQKILAAFVSEVSAQSGIHIQTDAANLLVADATSAQQ